MRLDDYRYGLFDSYASNQFGHFHTFNREDYESTVNFYRLNYLPFLPKDKNAKLLDVACGAGHFLYFLKQEGYSDYFGIDISTEMIALARQVTERVDKVDVFEFLSRFSSHYNVIIANDFIEHLNKQEIVRFLQLARSALVEDGLVILKTPNSACFMGAREVFIDFTHETFFTPESLSQAIRACGFSGVKVMPVKPNLGTSKAVIRNALWALLFRIPLELYVRLSYGWKATGHHLTFTSNIIGIGSKA